MRFSLSGRRALARTALAALVGLTLAACQQEQPDEQTQQTTAPPASEQAATPEPAESATAPTSQHTFGPEISAEDFAAHVKTLASDEFGGRAPGSPGEKLTKEYLIAQAQRLGLEPGFDGSWTQTVPMQETTADPASVKIAAKVGDETIEYAYGGEAVVGSRQGKPEVSVEDSPMVFVGYGVVAPEEDWNDYEGLDVEGKTVVILVNDPGFHAEDPELFQGERMTYYGRWTYKYEEAARQGAAAAIIVHDTEGAGYPWSVVESSWTGPQFDLPAEGDQARRMPIEGWITQDKAIELFEKAGLDLAEQRAAASKPGFEPVPMDATFSATVKNRVRNADSENVMAVLRGSERPDEAVIYMAHWDHLGRNFQATGDNIFNGAIDNATGVAGVLEIAERFVTQGEKPERGVAFLFVTLEESGLLGSRYYVNNPAFPLDKTAAVINLDAMPLIGETSDITVIGYGASELEDILTPIAAEQGRTLHAESTPEKGFYYRSDHFNFAKAGVPALYAKGGQTHVEHGAEHGAKIAEDYTVNRYHKPGDEYDPNWDLTGIVEDLSALYGVGRQVASGDTWPNWYEGNEFRAARDESRPAQAAGMH